MCVEPTFGKRIKRFFYIYLYPTNENWWRWLSKWTFNQHMGRTTNVGLLGDIDNKINFVMCESLIMSNGFVKICVRRMRACTHPHTLLSPKWNEENWPHMSLLPRNNHRWWIVNYHRGLFFPSINDYPHLLPYHISFLYWMRPHEFHVSPTAYHAGWKK